MSNYTSFKDNTAEMADDPSCAAFGCSLRHSPNKLYCSFHSDCDDLQKTTHNINKNIRLIGGYRKMLNWTHEEWGRYREALLNHESIPMKENEMPSQYLTRFHLQMLEAIE